MYDIIGDIHGHGDELFALLEQLGYENLQGTYRHSNRTAVFVGDFIDRGPQIREVLSTVRQMHSAGSALAVMGNHEFNALAFHTEDPANPGQHLRKHSDKNTRQHAATLRQLSDTDLHEFLDWFRRLPMWLDLNGLRVVHACWDAPRMAVVEAGLEALGGVSTEFLVDAVKPDTKLFVAVEEVLKGKEVRLPDGYSYLDKDGHERRRMRVRWFRSPMGETFASYAFSMDDGLPAEALPQSLIDALTPYPVDAAPVVFGHYWLQADRPTPLAPNVACVDYSVAKGGRLCAYRWDGEQQLSPEKFVTVTARPS